MLALDSLLSVTRASYEAARASSALWTGVRASLLQALARTDSEAGGTAGLAPAVVKAGNPWDGAAAASKTTETAPRSHGGGSGASRARAASTSALPVAVAAAPPRGVPSSGGYNAGGFGAGGVGRSVSTAGGSGAPPTQDAQWELLHPTLDRAQPVAHRRPSTQVFQRFVDVIRSTVDASGVEGARFAAPSSFDRPDVSVSVAARQAAGAASASGPALRASDAGAAAATMRPAPSSHVEAAAAGPTSSSVRRPQQAEVVDVGAMNVPALKAYVHRFASGSVLVRRFLAVLGICSSQ